MISPQAATRQMRYVRNVAIAVSCGDLTAEEAAAELASRDAGGQPGGGSTAFTPGP